MAAGPLAFSGWLVLDAAAGRRGDDLRSLLLLGSLLWAASALSMFGLPWVASHGLWPLRLRLAVAVPLAVTWFVVGRFVLPAPRSRARSAAWPRRSRDSPALSICDRGDV
ncbi:hypothetical protein [Cellulomonas pakistanensis]|nr:hypothetical protein [Cellulomonas pakistanensis]